MSSKPVVDVLPGCSVPNNYHGLSLSLSVSRQFSFSWAHLKDLNVLFLMSQRFCKLVKKWLSYGQKRAKFSQIWLTFTAYPAKRRRGAVAGGLGSGALKFNGVQGHWQRPWWDYALWGEAPGQFFKLKFNDFQPSNWGIVHFFQLFTPQSRARNCFACLSHVNLLGAASQGRR
eukprot:sb/3472090/